MNNFPNEGVIRKNRVVVETEDTSNRSNQMKAVIIEGKIFVQRYRVRSMKIRRKTLKKSQHTMYHN